MSEQKRRKSQRQKQKPEPEFFDESRRNQTKRIENPAFWFFLLLIPIVVSLVLAFMRETPRPQVSAPQAGESAALGAQDQRSRENTRLPARGSGR